MSAREKTESKEAKEEISKNNQKFLDGILKQHYTSKISPENLLEFQKKFRKELMVDGFFKAGKWFFEQIFQVHIAMLYQEPSATETILDIGSQRLVKDIIDVSSLLYPDSVWAEHAKKYWAGEVRILIEKSYDELLVKEMIFTRELCSSYIELIPLNIKYNQAEPSAHTAFRPGIVYTEEVDAHIKLVLQETVRQAAAAVEETTSSRYELVQPPPKSILMGLGGVVLTTLLAYLYDPSYATQVGFSGLALGAGGGLISGFKRKSKLNPLQADYFRKQGKIVFLKNLRTAEDEHKALTPHQKFLKEYIQIQDGGPLPEPYRSMPMNEADRSAVRHKLKNSSRESYLIFLGMRDIFGKIEWRPALDLDRWSTVKNAKRIISATSCPKIPGVEIPSSKFRRSKNATPIPPAPPAPPSGQSAHSYAKATGNILGSPQEVKKETPKKSAPKSVPVIVRNPSGSFNFCGKRYWLAVIDEAALKKLKVPREQYKAFISAVGKAKEVGLAASSERNTPGIIMFANSNNGFAGEIKPHGGLEGRVLLQEIVCPDGAILLWPSWFKNVHDNNWPPHKQNPPQESISRDMDPVSDIGDVSGPIASSALAPGLGSLFNSRSISPPSDPSYSSHSSSIVAVEYKKKKEGKGADNKIQSTNPGSSDSNVGASAMPSH